MAISDPLITTALTAGATTTSLAKARDGVYYATVNNVTMRVAMKAADPLKKSRQISISAVNDPSSMDGYTSSPSGKMSAYASLAFTPGSVVTETMAKAFLVELASLLTQSATIDALCGGSYE